MKMDYEIITLRNMDAFMPSSVYRYLIVLRGAGTIRIDSRSYTISLHDALTVPADASGVLEVGSELLLGCISLLDMVINNPDSHILTAENTEMIRRVFYMGLDVQDQEAPYFSDIQSSIDLLMFHTLMAANLSARTMNPQVYGVIVRINAHFSATDYDVRQDILATGYTDNHFRKLFREETGVTPTEFVTIRRIDKAKDLFRLFQDRIPIKEIAWQCGYQDPYYFSRQFKKHTGVSPQQFVAQL